MSRRSKTKKERALMRKRERRKNRKLIIDYLNEAGRFSSSLIDMNFGTKYAEIARYIDKNWRQGLNALIIFAYDENDARQLLFRKEDWQCLGDAALYASRTKTCPEAESFRLKEKTFTEASLKKYKRAIGL